MDGKESRCLPLEDPSCTASVWIYRTLPTALLAIGTVGNIFNMFVFSRRKLRASPCFLLMFLAVFDVISLWSLYIATPLRLGFDIDLTTFSELHCAIHVWAIIWSSSASHWTIAVFTIERLLFTIFPHRAYLHLNRNKSLVLMAMITVAIGTMLGVVLFQIWSDSVATGNNRQGTNETICALLKSDDEWRWPVWIKVELILPSVVIVPGNITLAAQLYKLRRAGTELDAQTTLLILVAGLLFVTVMIFGTITIGTQSFNVRLNISLQGIKLLRAVLSVFIMSNHSLDAALYSWKGTLFRRECKEILKEIKDFRCRCTPNT